MLKSLHGGIWLNLQKKTAITRPVGSLAAPVRLAFPLCQHHGKTAVLCVRKGETVRLGQLLGTEADENSCPVHASVSGKVTDIFEYNHPLIGKCMVVGMENDGRDTPYRMGSSEKNVWKLPVEEIRSRIRRAGIVSDAAPHLPLAVRLRSMAARPGSALVLNCVETEPYICRAQKLLDENPEEIAAGFSLLLKASRAQGAVLAVSDDYGREPDDLVKAARFLGYDIELIRVAQKYPAGHERYLGRIVGRPNAGFVYAEECIRALRAVQDGEVQLTKVVTVAGDAVEDPQSIEVRIGTSIHDVLDHCGLLAEPERVVLGSPMTGIAVQGLSIPVTKNIGAVLALRGVGGRAVSPRCINCGKCVRTCPQKLLPNYLAQYALRADFETCESLSIEKCIECGACAYVCPGKVPIVELIKNIKKAGLKTD